jgi:F0F1-type ATP synthase epsilon subunit
MQFLLSTPEYNNIQSNVTKVRVHLRNGIAEIYEQHQDLMGKVDNNIVEIESLLDNRIEKFLFVLQDAIFLVSNQELGNSSNQKGTAVYIYAKTACEINSMVSIEEFVKKYENKKNQLEQEKKNFLENSETLYLSSQILVLEDEKKFLEKILSVLKDTKN